MKPTALQPGVSSPYAFQPRSCFSGLRGSGSFCEGLARALLGDKYQRHLRICGHAQRVHKSVDVERIVEVPGSSGPHYASQALPSAAPFGSSIFAMAIVGLATVGGLCTAFTCFVLYIRPLLQSIDETCKATAEAAQKLEVAARELEETSLMFQDELPPVLGAVEHASKEFQELGETLNTLTGALSGFRSQSSKRKGYRRDRDAQRVAKSPDVKIEESEGVKPKSDANPQKGSSGFSINATTEGIQKQTMDGISKVASDIQLVARVLTPAMDLWQSRLAGIVNKVEVEAEGSGNQDLVEYVKGHIETESNSALPWISNWQKKLQYPKDTTPEIAEQDTIKAPDESHLLEDIREGVCAEIDNNFVDENQSELVEGIPQLSQDLDDLLENIHLKQPRPDSAVAVLDALYKAEQAAERAAEASGNLQQAVERAQISGAFEDISSLQDTDGMTPIVVPQLNDSASETANVGEVQTLG